MNAAGQGANCVWEKRNEAEIVNKGGGVNLEEVGKVFELGRMRTEMPRGKNKRRPQRSV
jgi:hypothetical protein